MLLPSQFSKTGMAIVSLRSSFSDGSTLMLLKSVNALYKSEFQTAMKKTLSIT